MPMLIFIKGNIEEITGCNRISKEAANHIIFKYIAIKVE